MPAADRSRWANSRAPDLDPWREQDACGVGFVARASGHRSADIARLALQALARVAHRGAAATDRSGDGAGLLTQIPAPLFYREAASRGIALAPGQPFAVGAFFLPREHDALGRATAIIEEVLCREGLPVLGWRNVPVDLDVLGAGARASCPTIRQVIIEAPAGGRQDDTTWERSLYLARRTIERRIAEAGPDLEPFFVCSLSCRTLVYKALLTGTQLAGFFPDLASSDYETALAIFHQRYSTNTTSSWPLVQPFRMLAHNGEINTLWGNRNAMLAREPALAGPPWGDAVDRLKPVIWSEGSDSASLDNALELLVRSGRDPVHALMMLVPEAHEGAVGRAGRAGLLGRRVRGIRTRPQRPAALPLQDHSRRTSGGGLRVGPRGPEPGRRGGERSTRSRRAAGGGHAAQSDPARRAGQARGGPAAALQPVGRAGHPPATADRGRARCAARAGARARRATNRFRVELRGPALCARADGERGAGSRVEHGRRHAHPAARAHPARLVRVSAPALCPGHEPGDRPTARDAGHVVADAYRASGLAARRPAGRTPARAERASRPSRRRDRRAARGRGRAGRYLGRDLERFRRWWS